MMIKETLVRPISTIDPSPQWSEVEERLLAERRTVIASLIILSLSADAWAENCNEQDRTSNEEAREELLSRREVVYRRLRQLDEALARLSRDTFGHCVECGSKIAARRLAVDPAVSRCLACQAANETDHHPPSL